MIFDQVAVIGAGAMGAGIAQVMATASMEVMLIDVSESLVEKAVAHIRRHCESDVQKGKITADEKARILGRIRSTSDLQETKGAGLIIEAIIEDRKAKAELFQLLNGICPPETIFASNTSTLSIAGLAAGSGRPARFVGLHFFNPVPVMKLVEVIPGLMTGPDTVQNTLAAMKHIRKFPILVQDCPGFIVNRFVCAYQGEAFLCAEEGISPEEIDRGAKAAGFPMGPLEMGDFVGLDVCLYGTGVMHEGYGDRFPVPQLLGRLHKAGRLGMKTGKGIYCNGTIDDEFVKVVKDIGARPEEGVFSIDRCILRAINEAVYCLQEGVATAEELDRAAVLGMGFPNKDGIGGPLHLADEMGLDRVLFGLQDLAGRYGTRFWPHHLLKTYVEANRLGRKTGQGFFSY